MALTLHEIAGISKNPWRLELWILGILGPENTGIYNLHTCECSIKLNLGKHHPLGEHWRV